MMMSRIFNVAVIVSLAAICCLGSNIPEEAVELSARAGSFFGIPIPDAITNIPVIGQLVRNFADLAGTTSASVFAPVLDALSAVSSGRITRDSLPFQMVDRATGGIMSALSGAGGLKPPSFDAQDLISIANNMSNHANSDAGKISKPVFDLINLPADVLGQSLKRVLAILQGQQSTAPTTPVPTVI